MNFHPIGRLAGALALTVALAGCIDVSMDIEVLSETTGRAVTTSTMGADIYPMIKAGAASEDASTSEGFCEEENGVLTENADGSATCVVTVEGEFAALMDGEEDGATFTTVSPGVVRVAFKTEDIEGSLNETTGEQEEMDAETKAMMVAFFEGHSITIRIRGKAITDTNMTLSADGKSAETVIPFLDIINGEVELPDELYAAVSTN